MKRTSKWAIGVVVTVTAAFAALQTVSAPTHQTETPPAETESPILTEVVATQPCGYQWAYQDDLELTASFDASIKQLDPNASGRAQLFGENCVRQDGTFTFSALETDFYVRTQVADLNQEEEFGNWVKHVMEIVLQIPREELAIQYGFVEFHFEKTETEQHAFRVPIKTYIDEAQSKTGAELFQMFYAQP